MHQFKKRLESVAAGLNIPHKDMKWAFTTGLHPILKNHVHSFTPKKKFFPLKKIFFVPKKIALREPNGAGSLFHGILVNYVIRHNKPS